MGVPTGTKLIFMNELRRLDVKVSDIIDFHLYSPYFWHYMEWFYYEYFSSKEKDFHLQPLFLVLHGIIYE